MVDSFALVLVICLVLLIMASLFFFKEKTRPLQISLSFWCLLFVIYTISPVKYQPISAGAAVLMAGSFLFFLIGYFIQVLSLSAVNQEGSKHQPFRFYSNRLFVVILMFVLVIILALYSKYNLIADLLAQENMLDVLPAIRERTLSGEGSTFPVKLADMLVIPFLFLATALIFQSGYAFKMGAFIIIFFVILFQIASMSRGYLVYLFFLLITLYYLSINVRSQIPRGTSPRKVMVQVLVILLVMFQVFAVVRARGGSEAIQTYLEETMTLEEWAKPVVESVPGLFINIQMVHYLSSGLAGFSAYSKDGLPRSPYYLGEHSFFGIVKLVRLARMSPPEVREAFNYNYKTIYEPTSTNVYTFFREQFEDFGFLGTWVLHFLWGWLLSFFYMIYLRKKTLTTVVLPVALTSWYMYGAFIMQTVFTNSTAWPILALLMLSFLERGQAMDEEVI